MTEIEEIVEEEVTEEVTESESEQEAEKIDYPYMVAVRFKNSSRSYSFGCFSLDYKHGNKVVVETSQGLELGECVADAISTDLYPANRMPTKGVLRIATSMDLHHYEDNIEAAKEAYNICETEIKDLNLEMHLLSAEYMLDRSKILFVYQAEQRVDFRELLKRLGSSLHCRIELRQIGERDKAKMVGGIGMCGMECCCARFKTRMDVISINMAKTQLLALNTEKLSGVCGKLMCCLKYENDNYKELTAGLPKMGAHVEYEGNLYRVTSMNVMTNEARLENSETFETITIDELKENAVVRKGVTIGKKTASRPQKQKSAPGVNKHDPVEDFRASESEKNRGISNESKDTSKNLGSRPHREQAPKPAANVTTRHFGSKAKDDNVKKPEVRKPNKINTNNPNVTVRSFKSSKTKAEEAKGKE